MKTIFSYLSAVTKCTAIATLALHASIASAISTFVEAKVNGDDQFKIYVSTAPLNSQAGFQYANGYGWAFTYTNTLSLPASSSSANFANYWVNIWVKDVGGGGPDLIGELTLTGAPGANGNAGGSVGTCTFDNGTTKLLTNTTHWKVTRPQTFPSSGPTAIGYPTWLTNYLPTWVTPSLIPTSLGLNGGFPWGFMPNINAAAQWITTPAGLPNNLTEAWFSAHIKC